MFALNKGYSFLECKRGAVEYWRSQCNMCVDN